MATHHGRPPWSPAGTWFRTLMMDELVRSVDALSRDQAHAFAERLGLAGVQLPVLLPGGRECGPPLGGWGGHAHTHAYTRAHA